MMNITQRSEKILEFLNELSDDDFKKLLCESGIEDCPFVEDVLEEVVLEYPESNIGVYRKSVFKKEIFPQTGWIADEKAA